MPGCRWLLQGRVLLQDFWQPEEELQRICKWQVVAALCSLQVEWTKDPDAPGAPSYLLKFRLNSVKFDLLLSENRSAAMRPASSVAMSAHCTARLIADRSMQLGYHEQGSVLATGMARSASAAAYSLA